MANTQGKTVITVNHPQRNLTFKPGYAFRGRNSEVLANLFVGIGGGVKGITADIQQNGGTGVQASAVVTPAAPVAADSVTLNGAALTAAQLHARGSATFASVAAGDVVTVAGVAFTAIVTPTDGSYQQFALGANDTAAAANFAAAVNGHPTTNKLLSASSAAGVTKFRALAFGTAGNAIALATSNGTRAAVSGAVLSGGAAPSGDQWDYGDTNAQAAQSLSDCLNRTTTAALLGIVTGSATATAFTATAVPYGTIGNYLTAVTSNGTRLPITGAGKLVGGVAQAANPL